VTASRLSRAPLYARVSTTDQTTDNQRLELRRYAEARGWDVKEFVDEGFSGANGIAAGAKRRLSRIRAEGRSTCWSYGGSPRS
jgi:DNA invertase Pin-like site-specific DNA recombinase